jgi:hypothetical protein
MAMGNTIKLVLSWLGLLGMLMCMISIFGIWYAERQVDAIREQLFDGVETSFLRIECGIDSVKQVLDDSQVTVEKVQHNLQEWTVDETSENLKARLQLETRAEQLVGRLEQTEALLAASGSAVEHVGQLLGLAIQTRKEQIGKLAVTLLASFTQLDQRLSGFAARITETRETIGRLTLASNACEGHSRDSY